MSSKWYQDPWVWGIGLLGIGGVFVVSPEARFVVADPIKRGSKLTLAPMDERGVVTIEPSLLASTARFVDSSITDEEYALARMIRSEKASQGEALAHVALNDAENLNWTLLRLLTYSTKPWSNGLFGKQFSAQYRSASGGSTWNVKDAAKNDNGKPIVIQSQVRRYATSKDPYLGDVEVARRAIANHRAGIDKTGGASKFLHRSAFGSQEGTSSGGANEVIERWKQDGYTAYTLPEYGSDLVLFRRV